MDTHFLRKVLVVLGIAGLMIGLFPGGPRHNAWG